MLLGLGLAACGARDPLFVPKDGASTILLFAVASPSDVRGLVIDSGRVDVSSTSLEIGDDFSLYAFYYAATPEEIGLPVGWIGVRRDETGQPVPLERGRRLRTSAVVNGVQTAWTDRDQAPEAIAGLTLDIETACVRLKVQSVPLQTETAGEAFQFVFSDGEDSIVVGGATGRFYRASPTGATLLTVDSTITAIGGGLRTEDGTLWVIGQDGRFASGDLERGIRDVHPRLELGHAPRIRLAGVSGSEATEIFAWTSDGFLAKFSGGGWTRLFAAAGADPTTGGLSVLRVGPDEAIAGRSDTPALLLHYRQGVVREVSLGDGFESFLGPRVLADVPDLGVVAGVAEVSGPIAVEIPHLYRLDQGAWSELGGVPSTVHHPRAMLAAGRAHFLFGGFRGVLLQYHDGRWDCPEVIFPSDFVFLLPITHGYAAVDDGFSTRREAEAYFAFFP